jgi:hypothetical protein
MWRNANVHSMKNDFTEHILEYTIVPAAPVIYNVMVSLL